jgi:hypothetical protein
MSPAPAREPQRPEEAKFAEELRKMEYEPLLPIEKKLIVYSLLLGTGLLLVLIAVSRFLPGA